MTKSWEVVGVTHNGETVCQDCLDSHELQVFNEDALDAAISPIFAENAGEDICERCSCPILGY